MRAVQLERLEGPEGLKLVDMPEPEAGDQVLIDVVAAGVSFPDLLLSKGQYQMKPPVPFVPGFWNWTLTHNTGAAPKVSRTRRRNSTRLRESGNRRSNSVSSRQ